MKNLIGSPNEKLVCKRYLKYQFDSETKRVTYLKLILLLKLIFENFLKYKCEFPIDNAAG